MAQDTENDHKNMYSFDSLVSSLHPSLGKDINEILYYPSETQTKVKEIAASISKDFKCKELVLCAF